MINMYIIFCRNEHKSTHRQHNGNRRIKLLDVIYIYK